MDDFTIVTNAKNTKEIRSKPLELIDRTNKLDMGIFRKKSNANTSCGIILSYAKIFKKQGNLEMALFCQELYKKIYNLQKQEKVILNNWKGKSSLEIIEHPDYFTIITFQKEDKDSEPKEIKRDITKFEVNRIINTINNLNKGKKISTRDIGEFAYKRDWDKIFSDRQLHTNLNLILRLLDYYNLTKYRGRYTIILKPVREIQEVLK
jgi:hypothetical protein